jgi:hypothetical protein
MSNSPGIEKTGPERSSPARMETERGLQPLVAVWRRFWPKLFGPFFAASKSDQLIDDQWINGACICCVT